MKKSFTLTTALSVLFAALLSAAPAKAGGFVLLWHTTKESSKINSVVSVLASITGEDGAFKGSWGAADPNSPNFEFGSRIEFLFGAAVTSTARPGEYQYTHRDCDTFLAKFGPRCEWYKPSRDGGIPYRYALTRESDEWNAIHRINKIDPADGNSAAKAMFTPGNEPGWDKYTIGPNMKSVWLRILNGARDATVRDIFGIQVSDVNHDDAWVQMYIQFTVYPKPTLVVPAPVAQPANNVAAQAATANADIVAKYNDLVKQYNDLVKELAKPRPDNGAEVVTLRLEIEQLHKQLVETAAAAEKARQQLADNQTKTADWLNKSLVPVVSGQEARIDNLDRWIQAATAAPKPPIDEKPAALAPWQIKRLAIDVLGITPGVDGVVLSVDYGADYESVPDVLLLKGKMYTLRTVPGMRALVRAQMPDGNVVGKAFGPDGK